MRGGKHETIVKNKTKINGSRYKEHAHARVYLIYHQTGPADRVVRFWPVRGIQLEITTLPSAAPF